MSFKITKASIHKQTFGQYNNNNRYDLCGQNYLPVWNLSKQDFIMAYYPADSSALVFLEGLKIERLRKSREISSKMV